MLHSVADCVGWDELMEFDLAGLMSVRQMKLFTVLHDESFLEATDVLERLVSPGCVYGYDGFTGFQVAGIPFDGIIMSALLMLNIMSLGKQPPSYHS